jgi:hypothetical protein
MAEPLDFAATCGVTFMDLSSLTKSSASILYRSQGDTDSPVRPGLDHRQRGIAFGVAVRAAEPGFDHKAVAVLHQGVAHIAEPGFLALALAVEAASGSVTEA